MSILKAGRPYTDKVKALHKQLENKDEIMKMNFNITKNFHKDVKRYALEHDITITNLIHIALQEYIKK